MPRPKKEAKKPAGQPSIHERVRQELQDFSDAEHRVAHALLGDYPIAGL